MGQKEMREHIAEHTTKYKKNVKEKKNYLMARLIACNVVR